MTTTHGWLYEFTDSSLMVYNMVKKFFGEFFLFEFYSDKN